MSAWILRRDQTEAAGRKAKARAAAPENRYRIEGEYVSTLDIAERIGTTRSVAMSRVARLRNASGPITWARLRGSP